MKALTLHQPWAELVRLGVKTLETRGWPTKYRGPVLIHAGAKQPPSWVGPVGAYQLRPFGRFGWVLTGPGLPEYRSTPRLQGHVPAWGAVVAVADLADCVPMVSGQDCTEHSAHLCMYDQRRLLLHSPLTDPWPDGQSEHVATDQLPYGDFQPGRFAWLLEDVRPLAEPIKCRGRQRLWNPDPDVIAQVLAQFHP